MYDVDNNDFLAYNMLFVWFTTRISTGLICMGDTKAFTLKHGGKQLWFDCYRYCLDIDHVYKRSKDAFYNNRFNRSPPPHRLRGDKGWQRVR